MRHHGPRATVLDGKSYCSPECEALDRDPEILDKLRAEADPPALVRKRAAIALIVTSIGSFYPVVFPPANPAKRWLSLSVFLIPAFFLVEVVTGKSAGHANLWYQSLPEWKRALIVLAVMIVALGALAGGVYLYIALSPRF